MEMEINFLVKLRNSKRSKSKLLNQGVSKPETSQVDKLTWKNYDGMLIGC